MTKLEHVKRSQELSAYLVSFVDRGGKYTEEIVGTLEGEHVGKNVKSAIIAV